MARICNRCQTEMVEEYAVRAHGGVAWLVKTEGCFVPREVGRLSAAICPKCGEVSFYVDLEHANLHLDDK